MRGNKYNVTNPARRMAYGILFDSQKEMLDFLVLKGWEKEGRIKEYARQVKFTLIPSYVDSLGKKWREIAYVADHVFYDTTQARKRVVDSKGMPTPEYLLKKKLFNYFYKKDNLAIEEEL
mgnify:CR=1 FL=1